VKKWWCHVSTGVNEKEQGWTGEAFFSLNDVNQTRFIIIDLDGKPIPENIPEPTYIAQSSPGNFHLYYQLEEPIPNNKHNRRLITRFQLRCDGDRNYRANGELRVPESINGKYKDTIVQVEWVTTKVGPHLALSVLGDIDFTQKQNLYDDAEKYTNPNPKSSNPIQNSLTASYNPNPKSSNLKSSNPKSRSNPISNPRPNPRPNPKSNAIDRVKQRLYYIENEKNNKKEKKKKARCYNSLARPLLAGKRNEELRLLSHQLVRKNIDDHGVHEILSQCYKHHETTTATPFEYSLNCLMLMVNKARKTHDPSLTFSLSDAIIHDRKILALSIEENNVFSVILHACMNGHGYASERDIADVLGTTQKKVNTIIRRIIKNKGYVIIKKKPDYNNGKATVYGIVDIPLSTPLFHSLPPFIYETTNKATENTKTITRNKEDIQNTNWLDPGGGEKIVEDQMMEITIIENEKDIENEREISMLLMSVYGNMM